MRWLLLHPVLNHSRSGVYYRPIHVKKLHFGQAMADNMTSMAKAYKAGKGMEFRRCGETSGFLLYVRHV